MKRKLCIALGALALTLAACGGDDDESTASTGTEPSTAAAEETVEATSTSSSASTSTSSTSTSTSSTSTTTTVPPSTTTPAPPPLAVAWGSAVDPGRINRLDPIPTFLADGIESRIENIIYVSSDAPGETGAECADEAQFRQSYDGGELATHCVIVQWAFDVAADFRTDQYSPDGSISARALITPEGRQINTALAASGFPGTVDNRLTVVFAGGEPSSTLKFSTGSNAVGHTSHSFVVPPLDEFQPAPWAA